MPKPKAIGSRGSWFAEVLGELIPCVSDHHLSRMHYVDPGANPDSPRWKRYIAAIRRDKRIILTHRKPGCNGRSVRDGYVAVFSVKNVAVTRAGLEFDLDERLLNVV